MTEVAAVMGSARKLARRSRNYRWTELMKRVFDLDVLDCPGCGGRMEIIATLEDPLIARKILQHLGLPADELELAPARGPPVWEDEDDEVPSEAEEGWI